MENAKAELDVPTQSRRLVITFASQLFFRGLGGFFKLIKKYGISPIDMCDMPYFFLIGLFFSAQIQAKDLL